MTAVQTSAPCSLPSCRQSRNRAGRTCRKDAGKSMVWFCSVKTNPDLPGDNQNVARTGSENRLVSGVDLNGVILASLGVCFPVSNRIWC